jgi:molybdopterin converting factor small subunit
VEAPPVSAGILHPQFDRLLSMQTTVLLFASWADALGPSVTVDLPASPTVADVLAAVRSRTAGRALPKPLIAVNHKYARADTPIREGDEVALIPPVAGG